MKGWLMPLGDLGEAIHDRTVVLNVLWGLNVKYDHMKALLKCTHQTLDPPTSQLPTAILTIDKMTGTPNMSQRLPSMALPLQKASPMVSLTPLLVPMAIAVQEPVTMKAIFAVVAVVMEARVVPLGHLLTTPS
jgi:hypothetical protein